MLEEFIELLDKKKVIGNRSKKVLKTLRITTFCNLLQNIEINSIFDKAG